MGVMISLSGSYDADYANKYQMRDNTTITISNLNNCVDYLELTVLTDNNMDLEMFADPFSCHASFENPCTIVDFNSGPIKISSAISSTIITKFAIMCNTNFQETIQFYTNAFSLLCLILGFIFLANGIVLTVLHNIIVCFIRTFGTPRKEEESLTGRKRANLSPCYSKHEYQSLQ
ncbi:hypothetical protein LOD99_6987 [Oopsacas minuta]|uniref:Uncharacterized protein n=1 Tax=Oopsacas minuta TaxID=111878 RepID=A0AAV7JJ81_9METZ|nr:hypothetical protein LOD99_6987 [Oopsacas minuta]